MRDYLKVDFIRFVPDRRCYDLGFDDFVVFSRNPERIEGDFIRGYLVEARDRKDLISKLRRARDEWIVGVIGDLRVLREAVMRKRVDVILDFCGRELDYNTVRFAREKDVAIEISLSSLLNSSGIGRVRQIEELKDLLRVIKKFDAPFVLTSGASDFYEMRPKRQILEFFDFLGFNIERAEYWLRRIIRRYRDPNYIMDGLEIEEIIEDPR